MHLVPQIFPEYYDKLNFNSTISSKYCFQKRTRQNMLFLFTYSKIGIIGWYYLMIGRIGDIFSLFAFEEVMLLLNVMYVK